MPVTPFRRLPSFISLVHPPSVAMSRYLDPEESTKPYKDPTPLPADVPKVKELGVTSAPLKSAAFFLGAFCKDYNGACQSGTGFDVVEGAAGCWVVGSSEGDGSREYGMKPCNMES